MTAVVWNQVSADAAMALDEIFHRNDSSEQRGPETHRGRKCLYKVNSLDGDLALIGPRPAESRARGFITAPDDHIAQIAHPKEMPLTRL
jgi:hypothetical protein